MVDTLHDDSTIAMTLVERSQDSGEIVRAEWDALTHDYLSLWADDWTRTDDVTEYWGEDDGMAWRIHLTREQA